jgi:hypothetical protein
VKKALAEAVANYTPEQKIIPKRYPTPSERHLATLNEPEETYGATTTVEVTIPSKEMSFAKEIFKRFGWEFASN